jgi:hypothetical protein
MSCRRFRINTHLTMPLELLSGPGATYARHCPGDEVDIDVERCLNHDRFIRGRVLAGDMTELEPVPPAAAAARAASSLTAAVKE